jgi:1-acyl-sn-glycerol-3-phosphate acyltransferase
VLRSLIFYIALIVFTVIFSLAAIFAALFTRTGNLAHLVGRLWGWCMLFATGIRVQVRGLEKIVLEQSYIFAANHQSQFDIFALLGHFPVQFRWLAKQELFRIPVFGFAMKGAGYIPIDRSDRKAAFRSIDLAADRIRQGTSIVIFPEGTRSLDGKLKSFKKGGFFLAIKSGRPIVPVSITGSYRILAKGTLRVHPGTIQIAVGDPIPTEGLTSRDKDWLISETRRRIQQSLPPEEQGEPEPELKNRRGDASKNP